jgi:DNA helicase-2/ATP-dependent DNA helicase PcrA
VGDDAQSIYAFRGANIQNILNFKDDYPDHQLFKLEQNYRRPNIIQAANSVIKHNEKQIPKIIWTANKEGDKINLIGCKRNRRSTNGGCFYHKKQTKPQFIT